MPAVQTEHRDFSLCITRACEKLSHGLLGLDEHVSQVTKAVVDSLQNPRDLAASYLVIAPRGAGKSSLINEVLRNVRHEADTPSFTAVYLYGMLHESVQAALRAIANSLSAFAYDDKDCEVASKESIRSLQHSTCNSRIQAAIDRIKQQGKGIVFILEDFERFAVPNSAQPVLYCISNLLQDLDLRGACLSMSTRMDAADGLEKRIKSRFNPHELVLSQPACSHDIAEYLLRALSLTAADVNVVGDHDAALRFVHQQAELYLRLSDCNKGDTSLQGMSCTDLATVRDFNILVKNFVTSDDFQQVLESQICRNRAMAPIVEAMEYALLDLSQHKHVAAKSRSPVKPNGSSLVETFQFALGTESSSLNVIKSLSVLELSLLVAMKRLEAADMDNNIINFHDVFQEYESLKAGGYNSSLRGGVEQVVEVADFYVAEKAWETLIDAGIVVQIGSSISVGRRVIMTVDAAEVEQALREHETAPEVLVKWGTRNITE